MAKQLPKYQWEEIRKDFEAGMTQAQLRKKYGLSPSTLASKIKRDGWRLSHEQSAAITQFKEASANISESFSHANDMQKKEMEERVRTILEDNELIRNNRKILKAFQGLIGKGIRENTYVTPQDIKAGVSAIKDIEAIANPQASKQEINIQNTNAQQTITKIEREIID
jgi:hypothetical protein